jgi:hypothetical protein
MMKLMPKLNPNGWDEMFSNKGVRNSYRKVLQTLQSLNPENLNQKQRQAADFFMNQGITFTVYSDDNQGIERIFPFDKKTTAINIVVLVSKTITIGAPFVNELDEPTPIIVIIGLSALSLIIILFFKSKS